MKTHSCYGTRSRALKQRIDHEEVEESRSNPAKRRRRHRPVADPEVVVTDSTNHPASNEVISIDSSLSNEAVRSPPLKLQRRNAVVFNVRRDGKVNKGSKKTRIDLQAKRKRPLLEYSIYQRMELMNELIVCLGQCFPRWKHRRFGLQRFYCHKFNIYMNLAAAHNYVRLLSNLWEGLETTGVNGWNSNNMWLQLLAQEYQVYGTKHRTIGNRNYSNSKRVEEVLQQLDEISSCFCSDKCAMDFVRHSSYWGIYNRTTVVNTDDIANATIGECYASARNIKQSPFASKIPAIASFYKERGIIHNFTRPYVDGVEVASIDGFKRSVVCLSCGRICWCSCQRKLFRTEVAPKKKSTKARVKWSMSTVDMSDYLDDFIDPDELSDADDSITEMHEFVNSLEEKKQSIRPQVAQTAIVVSHSRKLDSGVVHCYTTDLECGSDEKPPKVDTKQRLLRATMVRGTIEDMFAAITPRKNENPFVEVSHNDLDAWRSVPVYRSWQNCWWRMIDMASVDTSDINIKSYVTRALERLDALGNVRFNIDVGYISVGYLHKKNRNCCYWRHFYVSKLGLWQAFVKAVEYNLMITSLPIEIQLELKSMNWTVCKCYQGEMYRKSFSVMKKGFLQAYIVSISWYEELLKGLNLITVDLPEIGEEPDLGSDEFDERLFIKRSPKLLEGNNTVEKSFQAALKRKLILAAERRAYITGGGLGYKHGNIASREQHLLKHNLWAPELKQLLPSVKIDSPPNEIQYNQIMKNIFAQYPDLNELFNISVKNLEECVYMLQMYLENSADKGNMDLVEPILQMDENKLNDVIPQVPMNWVMHDKTSDCWTCVVECEACISCPPMKCEKLETCTKFKSGKEVIDLLCKKYNPCSVNFCQHPFHMDDTEGAADLLDNCCVVGFNIQKFGFQGAKALATEFRKRYIKIIYSSMKYDGSFTEALLGMIADEMGLLTSTDAYILPNNNLEEQKQRLLQGLTCGVCSSFGERLQSRNGTVLLKNLVKSSVPYERLCTVFGMGQIAQGILQDVNVDIKFCSVHMAWVASWKDCMDQGRVMFYRVEDLLGLASLEDTLHELDRHWVDAVSAHVDNTIPHVADRYQTDIACRLEEAFHQLIALQRTLYDAFHTAFAMALRGITDAKQEFKLLKRLWHIKQNNPGNVVTEDINAQSFALADALVFPFGSLHDEGTPPCSEAE
ncbi:AP2 domain transcription factor AP2VIIa-5, putative [Babesia ovis]|uniref:AP2 domain transcription factor AP2VIIa-5, putative n=1 Tax=Babesia ovis TaxID=5869 RepID=A0A9W5WUM8_BABOV|nr:AP2 domain transcription factor AP2VIIa-5, putative [Babesia ovis]